MDSVTPVPIGVEPLIENQNIVRLPHQVFRWTRKIKPANFVKFIRLRVLTMTSCRFSISFFYLKSGDLSRARLILIDNRTPPVKLRPILFRFDDPNHFLHLFEHFRIGRVFYFRVAAWHSLLNGFYVGIFLAFFICAFVCAVKIAVMIN